MADKAPQVLHGLKTAQKIQKLDEFGVGFLEDPQYKLNGLIRSQVRAKDDPNNVKRIQAGFEQGTTIPAMVVTKDGHVIDGNSTRAAAERMKRLTVHALVTDKTRDELGEELVDALGIELNDHGQPLSSTEVEKQAREMIEAGATNQVIATRLRMLGREVTGLKAQMEGERRVSALGVSTKKLSNAHLKRLGPCKLMLAPFKELVTLTVDAGLTVKDMAELITLTDGKDTSEEQQLEVLAHERAAREDQIRQNKLMGNGKPPLSRKIKRAAGAFLHLTNNLSAAVERSIDRVPEQVQTLRDLIDRAEALLALQEKESNG